MQLEWLGTYRNFVEKAIKFGNAYACGYQKEQSFGTSMTFSSAQLQTMEYILENEDKNQSMAEIASRLGISPSAFSKHVKKMLEKGMLEKYHTADNRKNVIVKVSPLGREVYADYCRYVQQGVFNEMFRLLEGVPPEALDQISAALELWANDLNRQPTVQQKPALIRIE